MKTYWLVTEDGNLVQVPDWAKWLAQHKNGAYFWYTRRPETWIRKGMWRYGYRYKHAYTYENKKDWTNQIFEIHRTKEVIG